MASYTKPIALRVKVQVWVEAVGAGTGPAGLGGLNANDPAYGQSMYPGAAPVAQTMYFQDAAQVPGTPGSITEANLNTALTQVVTDLAGATGSSQLISSTALATINGWFSGSP